jgi:hypothetical protein
MEARELRAAQQAVKDVTHFVEKRDNIFMTHQSGVALARLATIAANG